eukprot:g10260.t1
MPYSNVFKRAHSPFDFVDFGDIIPHNGLLVDEGLHDPLVGSVEFDVEELIDILKPPKLQHRDQKPLYYLDDEKVLEEQPFEDLTISESTSRFADGKGNEPVQEKDILTMTMEFLKLNKDNLCTGVDNIYPTDKRALSSSSASSESTFLEGAKMLTHLSILNEKEKLRKKLVSKYSNKRKSLLKNSFIKQRILANVHIENKRKIKALKALAPKKKSPILGKKSNVLVLNRCAGCPPKKRKLIEVSNFSRNHLLGKCSNGVDVETYKKPRTGSASLIAAY